MSRWKVLAGTSAVLAGLMTSPAAAHHQTQTLTDPVGDTPYPSLDIVRASLRVRSLHVYVTIETAARLSDEKYWPAVIMGDPRTDNFYPSFGVNRQDGVFDENGGPGNTTGPVRTSRSGPRSITYRFAHRSIGNLSSFDWNVISTAPDGQGGDYTAHRYYGKRILARAAR